MPYDSKRHKTDTPGIYFRERAKSPGSKQRVRVYSIAVKEGRTVRWRQTDAQGNDLLRLEDAKARKAELAKDKRNGAPVVKSSKVTFSEYADAWLPLQTELAPRTVEDYTLKLSRLKPLIGTVRLSDLNERQLSDAIGSLRKAYAPNTLTNTLVPVSCLLDDATAEGLIGFNPLSSLKAKQKGKRRKGSLIPRARNLKEQRILGPKEIDSLLPAATSVRYRVLLDTAIHSGLRQMELLGLTWGDIDFSERIMRVRFQLSRTPGVGRVSYTKTDAGRRDVPLSDDLVKTLREYRASTIYKSDADYVFTTGTGKPLGWSNVDRHCLASAVKAAGVREPAPKWHDLRHTYASLLIARNVDAVTVSKALGHSDPGFTLKVYAGLFDKDASAEKIRAATGNPQVNRPFQNDSAASEGQVLPFPGNPLEDTADAVSSG